MANQSSKFQRRTRTLPDGEYRETCYACFRPVASCFCHAIPHVKNRTKVLILQHQRERSHPFNTARIVNQSLEQCQLIVDRNEKFAQQKLPIGRDAALLYPGQSSQLLDEIPADQRPRQLVIIDGTWDQARTIFRDVPQLHALPQFKLAPSTPGQYRIRLEPTATSLSTLEATVQALQKLEPETEGFEKLLNAFETMVEVQLRHPDAQYDANVLPRSGSTVNIPKSFDRESDRIVVAYAEATPVEFAKEQGWTELNRKKRSASQLPPVYWIAERLSKSPSQADTFAATILPGHTISDANLSHMELSKSHFGSAVSLATFKDRWAKFFQPDDLLIVPNIKAIRMLEQSGSATPEFETIRSINYDANSKFESLESFLRSIPWPIGPPRHPGRAGKRLANAVSLVNYLRSTKANNSK